MSSVRMCDRCGDVFSERADGWSTYTGSKQTRDADGNRKMTAETLDACTNCTELMTTPQRPELTTMVTSPRQPTVAPSYEKD